MIEPVVDRIDVVLVGLLGALALGTASVLWHLLARPEAVLRLFGDHDPAFPPDEGTLRLLRVGAALTTLAAGFLLGGAMGFLGGMR